MKILLSVLKQNIDTEIDPRFGRADYFLVIDPESHEWEAIPNPAAGASGGAGIQAAQFSAKQGCQAVISGEFGPNAFDTLQSAGILMYLYGSCKTAREAIEKYSTGELERLNEAVGPGHTHHPA